MNAGAKEWLTIGQAAERLGVSDTTARAYVDAGHVTIRGEAFKLRSTRLPGGHRRVKADDVELAAKAVWDEPAASD